MRNPHLFNPEHIRVLEAEDRKIWQDPEAILKAVEIRPDFAVADLGCGSGYFTLLLARKAKKVYAIDVQKEMLDYLESKLRKHKIKNVELLQSNPDEIPLENESVNLLLSVNTLHEFENREKIIKEMNRVIKKTGNLLIVDFQKKETGFGPPVTTRISKTQAVKLISVGGFKLSTAKLLPYHYLLVFTKQ